MCFDNMAFRLLRETFIFNVFSTALYVIWCVILSLFPFLSKKKKLSLRGKCIIVTGGSRGVGEDLLGQFAKYQPAKVRLILYNLLLLFYKKMVKYFVHILFLVLSTGIMFYKVKQSDISQLNF